ESAGVRYYAPTWQSHELIVNCYLYIRYAPVTVGCYLLVKNKFKRLTIKKYLLYRRNKINFHGKYYVIAHL
ncbi:MAG: hypothetical protein LBV43_02180, partial [Prevotella sp.]|nr:hypothetical protein [Prevotella sp.]